LRVPPTASDEPASIVPLGRLEKPLEAPHLSAIFDPNSAFPFEQELFGVPLTEEQRRGLVAADMGGVSDAVYTTGTVSNRLQTKEECAKTKHLNIHRKHKQFRSKLWLRKLHKKAASDVFNKRHKNSLPEGGVEEANRQYAAAARQARVARTFDADVKLLERDMRENLSAQVMDFESQPNVLALEWQVKRNAAATDRQNVERFAE